MSVQDRNTTSQNTMPSSSPQTTVNCGENEYEWVLNEIKAEARRDAGSEPSLTRNKLCSSTILYDLFLNTFSSDSYLLSATIADLLATRQRDSACISFATIELGSAKDSNGFFFPLTSSRNAKRWYSTFYNVTAMVGVGVLSLPYALSQLGWYHFSFNPSLLCDEKQEKARLAELAAEKAHQEAIQAQLAIQRKLAEDQMNLVEKQSQVKAQMLRYEDELARKRMQYLQTDHEAQREHNAELARMQEESLIIKEQARTTTEEQIQNF
ncbi:unnamed protein product [Lactuca saligna]|uniref:Serine acetyltransferase N-terminal domain-containing protein n=1 Tax=Lactuca saligna TaxID=75948 RepID=A0AA36E7G4_LACSI|nr:unnamed protein product [Lactuca saligna]